MKKRQYETDNLIGDSITNLWERKVRDKNIELAENSKVSRETVKQPNIYYVPKYNFLHYSEIGSGYVKSLSITYDPCLQ